MTLKTNLYASLVLCLLTIKPAFSQVNFNFKEWEDPSVVELGKEPPHTFFTAYSQMEDALTDDPTKSPYVKSLNGTWKFYYVNTPEER